MEVQVSKSTCTLGTINNFDTYKSASDITDMISYLTGLPTGDTMYAGVSCDTASHLLISYVRSAALLSTFGANTASLRHQGSVAFFVKKGDPSFATTVVKDKGVGPATIVVTMSCKLVIVLKIYQGQIY